MESLPHFTKRAILDERYRALVPVLDLVVLRSADPAAARVFYEALGLVFTEEQHGGGPRHLAAILGNGTVLEIYPDAGGDGGSAPRLGFVVADVHAVLDALAAAGVAVPAGRDGVVVLTDPDGRSVHLTAAR